MDILGGGFGSALMVALIILVAVLAIGLIFAAIYVAMNLTADILSTLTNPRLLHGQST